MVDDSLCTSADTVGWASWADGATAANLKYVYAAYHERGLNRLLLYARTLLTSEVLAGYYAGPTDRVPSSLERGETTHTGQWGRSSKA